MRATKDFDDFTRRRDAERAQLDARAVSFRRAGELPGGRRGIVARLGVEGVAKRGYIIEASPSSHEFGLIVDKALSFRGSRRTLAAAKNAVADLLTEEDGMTAPKSLTPKQLRKELLDEAKKQVEKLTLDPHKDGLYDRLKADGKTFGVVYAPRDKGGVQVTLHKDADLSKLGFKHSASGNRRTVKEQSEVAPTVTGMVAAAKAVESKKKAPRASREPPAAKVDTSAPPAKTEALDGHDPLPPDIKSAKVVKIGNGVPKSEAKPDPKPAAAKKKSTTAPRRKTSSARSRKT